MATATREFNNAQMNELNKAKYEYGLLAAAMKSLDLSSNSLNVTPVQFESVRRKIAELRAVGEQKLIQDYSVVINSAYNNFDNAVNNKGVVALSAFSGNRKNGALLSSASLDNFFASRGLQPVAQPVTGQAGQQPVADNTATTDGENPLDNLTAYARLRPYFEIKDLAVLRRCVMNPFNEHDNDLAGDFHPGALDCAAHMLSWMRSNGYSYSLPVNQTPGKLRVSIDGTNLSVRVLDGCIVHNNPDITEEQAIAKARSDMHKIGRVSDRGQSYYFSNDGAPGTLGTTWTPTLDERLMPLKFALGLSGAVDGAYYVADTPTRGQGRIHAGLGGGAHRKFIVELSKEQGLPFSNADEAEQFLRESIDGVKQRYKDKLRINEILSCVEAGADFQLSDGDKELSEQQMSFYSFAIQAKALDETGELAGMTLESAIRDPESPLYSFGHIDDLDVDMVNSLMLQNAVINDELVFDQGWQAFVDSYTDAWTAGTMDSFETGFNPAVVARSMSHGGSHISNGDALVAAMKMCEYDINKLHDSEEVDYYVRQLKDKSIVWDARTARTADTISHPFGKRVLETIKETLEGTGITAESDDISMDDQGVIFWKGTRTVGEKNPVQEEISGQLGQVFLPDATGTISTLFEGTPNHEAIPGYRAHLTPSSEGGEFRDRHRVRGYEQIMLDAVRHQIRHDALSSHITVKHGAVDNVTALNRTYGHLYEDRFWLGELDNAVREGDLPGYFVDSIKTTLAGRVRYTNFYKGSTTNAESRRRLGLDRDSDVLSPLDETGGRNLRVLSDDMDGIFCKDGSPSGNLNQGLVRYLADGATVNADGTLEAGDDVRCALLKLPEFRNSDYNPWNRTSMALLQALAPPRRLVSGVGAAMMGMGGFNMDDGFVVSREFTEQNSIETEVDIEEIIDGKIVKSTKSVRRPLRRGDKISDFNGNKGVIGLIVDRNKTASEQSVPGLPFPEEAVAIFRDNPDLDVVMSPYSLISRGNGGLAREMMENPSDLIINGETVKGALGRVSFMITNKTVDENSHVYEDFEALSKGRRFSATLSMGLASADCPDIIKSAFGGNIRSFENYREYLISTGLDITADGVLREGYAPHHNEQREIFRIETPDSTQKPIMHENYRGFDINGNQYNYEGDGYEFASGNAYDKILYQSHNATQNSGLSSLIKWPAEDGPRQAFIEAISTKGGFLEIPFPLTFYRDPSLGAYSLAGMMGSLDTQEIVGADGRPAWLAPIIAPELREAQELRDGENMYHNFTQQYGNLYEQVYNYKFFEDRGKRRQIQLTEATELFNQNADALEAASGVELDFFDYSREYEATNDVGRRAVERKVRKMVDDARVAAGEPSTWDAAAKKWTSKDPLYSDWVTTMKLSVDINDCNNRMKYCKNQAQEAFSKVTREITTNYVNGKNGKGSYLRDNVTGRRMPSTGTLVCIPEPRLPLGTVSMNGDSMRSLGLAPGGKDNQLLKWRDPITKDGGIRYMDVIEDPSVDGIGVNPAIANSFSMDFDGDSVGVMKLNDSAAALEARKKLTPKSHLLNTGVKEDGKHPLYFNMSQDVTMFMHEHGNEPATWAEAKGASMKERMDSIIERLNWSAVNQDEMVYNPKTPKGIQNDDAYREINAYFRRAFKGSYGASPLQFSSVDDLYKGLSYIVESGAKGSQEKLDELCHNMGIGKNEDGSVFDLGKPPDDVRAKANECQRAVAMNADDTGLAGGFKQLLMGVFMDKDPKTVLEVVEPVMQGVLSIKGNVAHAEQIDKILRCDLTNVLRHGVHPDTKPSEMKDAEKLTKKEFEAHLVRLFTDKETGMGLKINPDHVHNLAGMMVGKDGLIRKPSEIMGEPMMYVSYNVDGNQPLTKLRVLAAENKNLFDGKYSRCFAPNKVQNADKTSCIAKSSSLKDKEIASAKQIIGLESDNIVKAIGTKLDVSRQASRMYQIESNHELRTIYEIEDYDREGELLECTA